jgi:hypothetical protein
MMRSIDRQSPSLLELLRRARLFELERRRSEEASASEGRTASPSEIVSPRDERGTPYPGDFPNVVGQLYRGCF